MTKSYRIELDILKAICIFAVIFYHIGWLSAGYIAVDILFFLNGYLVIPNLILSPTSKIDYTWILKRTMRLMPLVAIATATSLAIGLIGMLPDDYENLAQSVIASDLMAQNVLSAITTKNYWNPANEFRPLMHLWYVGVLMQFYFFIWAFKTAFSRMKKNQLIVLLWILFAASLILYLSSDSYSPTRFYYLPYRLFEIIGGGLLGIHTKNNSMSKFPTNYGITAMGLLFVTLFAASFISIGEPQIDFVNGNLISNPIFSQEVLLLSALLFGSVFLCSHNWSVSSKFMRLIAFFGKISFGIFIWHQILLAFYRYYISSETNVQFVLLLCLTTVILATLCYYGIEQKVKPTWRNLKITAIGIVLTIIPALWIYKHGGIVRDVPELNISITDARSGIFAEYNERFWGYYSDFPDKDNGKINILVEGVSFARDFGNILLESNVIDKINLSYIDSHNEKHNNRYAKCDVMFTLRNKSDVPQFVWENLNPKARVYGIGTKNFGTSNGIVYQHRHNENYLAQTVSINPNFHTINNQWEKEWGSDHYIDIIELCTAPNGEIRIFTDEGKFISQDCQHLTQAGAKFLANRINFEDLLAIDK